MLGKILDFIFTRLRSTEIALDSLSLVQYDFCRTKTRANKIPNFTKHCRITYYYTPLLYSKSNRKAMNRNWSNQKSNPALKTKAGNKQILQIDKIQG